VQVGSAVHILKSSVATFLGATGILRLAHRLRRPHILVLAYHRVTPDTEMQSCAYPAMHVSASTFRAQLRALSRLYRIVSMHDLQAVLAGKTPLCESVAVVTFDDGYHDNYRVALPILVEADVPATFFVSVGFVGRGEPFWFDRLAQAVERWGEIQPTATAETLPAALVQLLSRPGAFAERLRGAAAHLKSLPDAERDTIVQQLDRLTTGAAAQDAAAMTWDEVRVLRDAGMQVGAHGMRHGILTRMPPEAAWREIRDSVSAVATEIGAPVTAFAYPNGDTSDAVADLARTAGVSLAFTMAGRAVGPDVDPLRIARRNVCEATSRGARGRFSRHYFWCEITGVFDFLTARHFRARRADA